MERWLKGERFTRSLWTDVEHIYIYLTDRQLLEMVIKVNLCLGDFRLTKFTGWVAAGSYFALLECIPRRRLLYPGIIYPHFSK